MVAWCRGGVKCVYIHIYVSEDLAVEYLGFIVVMNKDRHRIVHKLIIDDIE